MDARTRRCLRFQYQSGSFLLTAREVYAVMFSEENYEGGLRKLINSEAQQSFDTAATLS
jgi:hypothetical protein